LISTTLNMNIFRDDIQKICWIIEKMSQSNGPIKVYQNKGFNLKYKVQWSIIQPFVESFPE